MYTAARKLVAKGLYLHDDTVECPRVLNLTKKLHRVEIPTLVNVLKSEAVAQLSELWLENNYYPEFLTETVAVAASGGLQGLNVLYLGINYIKDADVQVLTTAIAGGAFRELQALRLMKNLIGDAGLTALATEIDNGGLPNLEDLNIRGNEIGDDGLTALIDVAANGRLAKLEGLIINENKRFSLHTLVLLATKIRDGDFPCLKQLAVNWPDQIAPLQAACKKQDVRLFPLYNLGYDE